MGSMRFGAAHIASQPASDRLETRTEVFASSIAHGSGSPFLHLPQKCKSALGPPIFSCSAASSRRSTVRFSWPYVRGKNAAQLSSAYLAPGPVTYYPDPMEKHTNCERMERCALAPF